ncbi:toll/interleukin-1 receptor domain-containing protein, partial [Nostoc sp. UIC 10630]|uniref:toll/interleukin-1 receptor domain-containing protein n=1 Tax=Nostoc sp. UIC 10630 TaxID=2100146 RepID=UPI00158A685C
MRDFLAELKKPLIEVNKDRQGIIRPFAKVTATILKNLGGNYLAIAQEIEQAAKTFEQIDEDKAKFDVLLVHNTQDKYQIKAIATALTQRNLKPWLYEGQFLPDEPFQNDIQQIIPLVKSAAIFIDSQELGRWQNWELKPFIDQCVINKIPVIPVLLPGISNLPEDLVFLKQLRWVTFSNGINDKPALDLLQWGITGEKPNNSEQLEEKPGKIPTEDFVQSIILGNIDSNEKEFNEVYKIVDGNLNCFDRKLNYLNQNKENLLNKILEESNIKKIEKKLIKENINIQKSTNNKEIL